MAAPIIYRSTDASAPALTGQSGTLVALLDACLVNGYGSKPAAGWTKPFVGAAGQAAYRQGGSGYQGYLSVNDAGPGAGSFREARAFIYDTLTAWNTGTFQAPPTTSAVRKSSTLDATARAWLLIADPKTFYLFVTTGDADPQRCSICVGHFTPQDAADASPFWILTRGAENSGSAINEQFGTVSTTPGLTGHYCVKNRGGTAIQQLGKAGDIARGGSSSILAHASNAMPFPNPADSCVYVAPILLCDPSNNLRGRMRGLWQLCHRPGSFADGDTFDATGEYAGRQFMVVTNLNNNAGTTHCVVETTDWDA